MRYQLEKNEFTLKLKEELMNQGRDQIKRNENLFKEETERLRKQFFEEMTKEFNH